MQEVELTCEGTPEVLQRVEVLLAGKKPERIVVNEDRYYDTDTTTFFEQAVFVRVRTQGAVSRRLQFKFDEPESERLHIACTERDFPLLPQEILPEAVHTLFCRFLPAWKPQPTWEQVCASNGLHTFVSIHKTRSLYRVETLTLCLDQVEGLGTFIEVEQLCEEGMATHEAQLHVRQVVAALGGEPLTAGYVELALRRQRPEIYQRGLYYLA